jgi:hypothetical protein
VLRAKKWKKGRERETAHCANARERDENNRDHIARENENIIVGFLFDHSRTHSKAPVAVSASASAIAVQRRVLRTQFCKQYSHVCHTLIDKLCVYAILLSEVPKKLLFSIRFFVLFAYRLRFMIYNMVVNNINLYSKIF